MEYIISYDIVGLLLLAILYVFICLVNPAPARTTHYFKVFIYLAFTGAFLDVFTIWTNQFNYIPFMLIVNNILAVIHLTAVGCITPLYYIFILAITNEQQRLPKWKKRFAYAGYIYIITSIGLSPFNHLVMYFNQDGKYLHGPAYNGIFAVVIIFLFAGVFELTKNIKKITLKQFIIVLSYTIIDLAAIVFQFFNPSYLMIGFSCGISLLFISFALKNPMELQDVNVGMYNRTAFMEYLIGRPKKSIFAVIHVSNGEAIKYMYGLDNGYSIIRKCINIVLKETRQKLSFYVLDSTFVFVCKNQDEAYEKIRQIKQYQKKPIKIQLSNEDTETHEFFLQSEVFYLEESLLLDCVRKIESKKKPIDKILDFIQFLVLENSEENEGRIIGDKDIESYKERLRIQKVVDEAMETESFEVFLQPIFDLKLNKFTGAESLIRLRDPNGKMISPGLFIPEAEKNGKILKLGDISIKKTCEFIKKGNLKELGIEKVNINLSMVQCMQDNIEKHLMELLNEYDIPASMIRFEITEGITASSPEKLSRVMKNLVDCGIEFALDDYGTGYSNTSRLLEFPFSEIKFDKSFVDSAAEDSKNILTLRHLMTMVNEAQMIVLVEGVETKEMSDLIQTFGGELIQGFYYAKPYPLKEFVEFISEKNK